MKLGMICRYDNSGIGTLSWEFARHLKPHKVLLVQNHVHQTFPERYSKFNTRKGSIRIDQQDMDWLLDDIDVLLMLETPYNWGLIPYARRKVVKTALYTMYEMTPDPIPANPDLFVCPSKLDMQYFPDNKTLLPPPIATDRVFWKERKTAKTFIHSASHNGVNMRKGTHLLVEAIPLVKNQNIKFKIYTWNNVFTTSDPRLDIEVVNFKNYWQIWREGDVLIYPQDYNGICLPIVEAMSAGLGVITTDIYPFNEYMPKELLFKPSFVYRTRASSRLMETDAAKIEPKDIAEKIDEWAEKDITQFSHYGRTWAQENNWEKWLPKYREVFENLCQQPK